MYDWKEWQGFARRNELQMPQLYEAPEGWKSVCGQTYNFGYKKKNFSFIFSFYCYAFHGIIRAVAVVARCDDV